MILVVILELRARIDRQEAELKACKEKLQSVDGVVANNTQAIENVCKDQLCDRKRIDKLEGSVEYLKLSPGELLLQHIQCDSIEFLTTSLHTTTTSTCLCI